MTKKAAVMTRAWEIRKAEKTTMSVSLKKAWAEAKAPLTIHAVESKIKSAYSFFDTNTWCKAGMERVYVGRAGFVALVNGKVEWSMKTLRDNKRMEALFNA